MIYLINFAGLNDLKIHEQEVKRGQTIDAEANVNDGIKNFSVFAGHKKSSKGVFFSLK
jgi:hypothetical protein